VVVAGVGSGEGDAEGSALAVAVTSPDGADDVSAVGAGAASVLAVGAGSGEGAAETSVPAVPVTSPDGAGVGSAVAVGDGSVTSEVDPIATGAVLIVRANAHSSVRIAGRSARLMRDMAKSERRVASRPGCLERHDPAWPNNTIYRPTPQAP
jgi:hypothetical protein